MKGIVRTRRVGRGEHIRLSADRLPRIQVKDPLLGKCHPSAISLKTEVEFNFARIILRILLSSATSARSSKSFGACFFNESGWASHLRVGDGRFWERVRGGSPSAKFQQFPYPTILRIFAFVEVEKMKYYYYYSCYYFVIAIAVATLVPVSCAASRCADSDRRISFLQHRICASLGEGPRCPVGAGNVSAQHDWPNQAIYYKSLLSTLSAPETCLNTSTAMRIAQWLNDTETATSEWWYTWLVFQVNYYRMPMPMHNRVESPATLGRKCYAFAYLGHRWQELRANLSRAMQSAGLSLTGMIQTYDSAVLLTMGLCNKVAANCFLNATYNPELRNGTCPNATDQFFIGFQWENGNNDVQPRGDSLPWPAAFPKYGRTGAQEAAYTFAVNTALNFII